MKRGVRWATALVVVLNLAVLAYYMFRPPRRGRSDSGPATALPASTLQAGVYSVTGEVKELRLESSNIVIRHQAIPGYMAAMTMPFNVRDTREVVTLHAGDQVIFRLLVTDDESWIDSVQRIKAHAPSPDEAQTIDYASARIVRDVEPLEPGAVMPDDVFTNQFGLPVRFSDFRGQAVGLTFMFTRCPLPDFCPRMLKNFAATIDALQAQQPPVTNWHLVTITIDPVHDTPEVLRNHAELYQYDPRKWSFLTGAMIDIDALSEQLGLVFRRQTPTALPDHNLRTAVIDPAGRLVKVTIGNTWKPEELVADILAAARTPR